MLLHSVLLLFSMIYELFLSMTYKLKLSMTYQFQSRSKKTDCTDLWVIKLTNQVYLSSGFQAPHWMN